MSASDKRERFEAATLPFMRVVHAVGYRLCRDPDVARELAQETYLRAYRTFDNFQEGTNCKAWLLKIVYSVFVNRYHKRRREPMQLSLDERFPEAVAKRTGIENVDFDNTASGLSGAGPEIDRALGELPEAFRSAVLLVDVEELTYDEAASVLDCPVGTVRSRLSRARKMLYVALSELARDRGYLEDRFSTS